MEIELNWKFYLDLIWSRAMLRTLFLISLILTCCAKGASAQTMADDPSRFFGKWHIVRVDWGPDDEEFLRKEVGTTHGEFDSERFDKYRTLIQRNIESGHYCLNIRKSNGKIEGDSVTYRNFPNVVLIEYRTSCNTCSGTFLMQSEGGLTRVKEIGRKSGCTQVGCAVESVIRPFSEEGMTLNEDTLIMPLPNGRIYYFTK